MFITNSPDSDFWRNKKVLVTGHTGFKGAWLTLWLNRLGSSVAGISLKPQTQPNLFELAQVDSVCEGHFCDIRNVEKLALLIRQIKPEIVFHMAAQAIVRTSYDAPLETFSTNILGTVHILEALRLIDSVKVLVAVTTDKVYRDLEYKHPCNETDPLGGHDPYSASKAASELVITSYRDSFLAQKGIAVSSARAGNVLGGGDWSIDRLIPDAVRAWENNIPLQIRHPDAVRPWQHVLEPLAGYLRLVEKSWEVPELGGAYNFGPPINETATVRDVIESARTAYGSGQVHFDKNYRGPYEESWLALATTKSRDILGVNPQWGLQDTIIRTMNWYKKFHDGIDVHTLCQADLDAFV